MALDYSYTKLRKNFGKQPLFCQVAPQMIDSIYPNKAEQKKYILRNPVHTECQVASKQSEHHINTNSVIFENVGVNHVEGGWPKDVNYTDEEQIIRYRRRIEREDTYINAVLGTHQKLSKYIMQNNAIEMYDMFFKGMNPVSPVETTVVQLTNMYRDTKERPIASICWTIEEDPKLVVAYSDMRFPLMGTRNQDSTCAIWNLENPNEPTVVLCPPSPCWQATTSPAHRSFVIGGLEDGRVCVFDIRSKKEPVMVSPAHLAHRDPVRSVVYLQSRLNTEFFSGSTDGACMWWDVRNLSQNTDYLLMSINIPPGESMSMANAEPVTTLQYDKSIPTKFFCGTDTGMVIGINRKGKTHKEMVTAVFHAHNGPVKAVHRSPCATKLFITCGDWTAHLWSEDITTSPIVTGLNNRYQILDVAWAPQRLSCYMSVGADGKFCYWDLLRKYREPVKSLKLSKYPLSKVKPQEEGRLIAVGDAKGIVYILSLSDSLALSANKDKQLMLQMYERETRREHILETRIKEIRLKQTTEEKAVGPDEEVVDLERLLKKTEEEYRKVVADELRHTGHREQSEPVRTMRKR